MMQNRTDICLVIIHAMTISSALVVLLVIRFLQHVCYTVRNSILRIIHYTVFKNVNLDLKNI